MVNLQSEVIELEFLEFSKGMQTISEEDFARILLRYTNLEKAEIGECLTRVRNRMPEEKVRDSWCHYENLSMQYTGNFFSSKN